MTEQPIRLRGGPAHRWLTEAAPSVDVVYIGHANCGCDFCAGRTEVGYRYGRVSERVFRYEREAEGSEMRQFNSSVPRPARAIYEPLGARNSEGEDA